MPAEGAPTPASAMDADPGSPSGSERATSVSASSEALLDMESAEEAVDAFLSWAEALPRPDVGPAFGNEPLPPSEATTTRGGEQGATATTQPTPVPTVAQLKHYAEACMRCRSYARALLARTVAVQAHANDVPFEVADAWLRDATGAAALEAMGHPDADGNEIALEESEADLAFDACLVASVAAPSAISQWHDEPRRAAATAAAARREAEGTVTTPLSRAFCNDYSSSQTNHVQDTMHFCVVVCMAFCAEARLVRRCLVYLRRLWRVRNARVEITNLPLPSRLYPDNTYDAGCLEANLSGFDSALATAAAAAFVAPCSASLWAMRVAATPGRHRNSLLMSAIKHPLANADDAKHPLLDMCLASLANAQDSGAARACTQRGESSLRAARAVHTLWSAALSATEKPLAAYVALASAEKGKWDRLAAVWEHAVASDALRKSPTAWLKLTAAYEANRGHYSTHQSLGRNIADAQAMVAYERALIALPEDGRLRRRMLEYHGIVELSLVESDSAVGPNDPSVRYMHMLTPASFSGEQGKDDALHPRLNAAMDANGRLFHALVHDLPYASGGSADYHDLYRTRSLMLFRAAKFPMTGKQALSVLNARLAALREHNLAWLDAWHTSLGGAAADASEGYIDIIELWGRQENNIASALRGQIRFTQDDVGEEERTDPPVDDDTYTRNACMLHAIAPENATDVLYEMCLAKKDNTLGTTTFSVSNATLEKAPTTYLGIATVRSVFAPSDPSRGTGAGPGFALRGCARNVGAVWNAFVRHTVAIAERSSFRAVQNAPPEPGQAYHIAKEEPWNEGVAQPPPPLMVVQQRLRNITAAPWLASLDGGYAAALPLAREGLVFAFFHCDSVAGSPDKGGNDILSARKKMCRAEEAWIESYELMAAPAQQAGAGGASAAAAAPAADVSGEKRKREDPPPRKRAKDRHTVFVKNLSYSVTEDVLKTHVQRRTAEAGTPLAEGALLSVMIARDPQSKKSRGLGFVEVDSEETVATVVAALDATELDGRAMLAVKATPVKDRPGGGGRGRGGGRGGREEGAGGRGRGRGRGFGDDEARARLGGRGRGGLGSAAASTTMLPRTMAGGGAAPAPKSNADFRSMFIKAQDAADAMQE